jgi:hypothetical protein
MALFTSLYFAMQRFWWAGLPGNVITSEMSILALILAEIVRSWIWTDRGSTGRKMKFVTERPITIEAHNDLRGTDRVASPSFTATCRAYVRRYQCEAR